MIAADNAKVEYPPLPDKISNWGIEFDVTKGVKKRHLWIWSKVSNKGKTTFGNKLVKEYGGFNFAYSEKF